MNNPETPWFLITSICTIVALFAFFFTRTPAWPARYSLIVIFNGRCLSFTSWECFFLEELTETVLKSKNEVVLVDGAQIRPVELRELPTLLSSEEADSLLESEKIRCHLYEDRYSRTCILRNHPLIKKANEHYERWMANAEYWKQHPELTRSLPNPCKSEIIL
jgi:hypothetical protein